MCMLSNLVNLPLKNNTQDKIRYICKDTCIQGLNITLSIVQNNANNRLSIRIASIIYGISQTIVCYVTINMKLYYRMDMQCIVK